KIKSTTLLIIAETQLFSQLFALFLTYFPRKKPFDLFTKNRMDSLFYERSFFSNVIVSSNSASIVVFSLYVALLTMIVMNKFNKNPGTISYNVSVSTGVMPQINTVIAPTIIPLSAPMFVIFLQ